MRQWQTHTAHSRYFGLFNPAPTTMGIAGEALAAIFNTQLAAWSHGPFAVQTERYLVRELGQRFDSRFMYGCFTSGGAEANLTAFICALVRRFPGYRAKGIRSLEGQPIAYASTASHHSLVKAARIVGMGTEFLRIVPCDSAHRMDISALKTMISEDRRFGHRPFLVVATVGATATGIVEPIESVAQVAQDEGLWLHVDAAWGGFAAFVPELRPYLAGVSRADSITFDPHKMFSVPMGAGMFFTADHDVLGEAFAVVADYMPARDSDDEREDPFTHSIQWSRRFIGLKVLLSLAVAGWEGYANVLRRQVLLADELRQKLENLRWRVVNPTPFPVVCAIHDDQRISVQRVVERVQQSGNAWISIASLPDGASVLRACITNYRTNEDDVLALVREIQLASERELTTA
ncbi:MAG: pyridoxal phosphate-dependent decarboxylase family protein [Burkholderiales bacterium]